jgi:type I restriction enzyme S subunit
MPTSKAPDLRFPNFTNPWFIKDLLGLSKNGFTNGVFNDPAKVGSGYKLINVKDMYTDGTIQDKNLTLVAISKEEFSRNKVEYGDIFFTRSSLVKEGIAYSNIYLGHGEDITYDGHLIRMQPNDLVNPNFVKALLSTSYVRRQLIAFGTTTTMTTIGQKEVSAVKVFLPDKNEQNNIADFLSAVDKKVSILERKVKLLEKYKRGVMQRIFCQNIRFKDESGKDYPDWDEKFLGQIAKISKGSQLNKDTLSKFDEYPVINGGIKPSGFTDKWNVDAKTITISEGGNSCGYVNFIQTRFWSGGHCYSLSTTDNIETRFLFQLLKFNQVKIMKLRVGSGLPNIQKTDLSKLVLQIPSKPEQERIAKFLAALDNKIDQEMNTLAQAKLFKKALVQRMFV